MAELQLLLENEIPAGRKALIDSHQNLQKVSAYCKQRYLDDPDKRNALEETKNYTTQSLASVAYQINTLASNMLNMLDIQAAQLATMESSLNNISQTVDIHKEKVARREIGLLTTSKIITRSHQVVAPQNPDRATKYIRKPVDYTELDDLGHGVKLGTQQTGGTMRRSSAGSKKPPSPNPDRNSKELSKKEVSKNVSSAGYGTLRAVKAPTVPQDYSQSRRLPSMVRHRTNSNSSSGSAGTASQSSSMGYMPGVGSVSESPAHHGNIPPPPPLNDMSSPMMGPPPPPPPPPLMQQQVPDMSSGYSTPVVGSNNMATSIGHHADYAATSVMNLPPPPLAEMDGSMMPPPPPPPPALPADPVLLPPPPPIPSSDDMMMMPPPSSEPSWAPHNYLEKMIVLYEYAALNSDELNLSEDQIVYVIKKNNDGWYEGVVDGVTGLFPGNYAEPL